MQHDTRSEPELPTTLDIEGVTTRRRIHQESPNVFLCVSSFNPRARALYEALGFETVGELRDYLVRGHSEWLLRKSLGPYSEWRR